MSDNPVLREKAREVIQAGTLPNRFPERTWGGPGVGADCTICNVPVTRDELEFEIEFANNGEGNGNGETPQSHHVHIRCFAIWDQERRSPVSPLLGTAPMEAT